MDAAPSPNNQTARLLYVLKEQMTEIDRLRTENDQLKKVITEGGALGCLQSAYSDPTTSTANKIKAAASALPFERPKLTVNMKIGPSVLGARLDAVRVIEHQPGPPEAA